MSRPYTLFTGQGATSPLKRSPSWPRAGVLTGWRSPSSATIRMPVSEADRTLHLPCGTAAAPASVATQRRLLRRRQLKTKRLHRRVRGPCVVGDPARGQHLFDAGDHSAN